MINKKNIVLIGFMGTGKTSVGKVLAKRLSRELVDLDVMIEEKEKRKISEIFEREGEPYFRMLEKKAVTEVSLKESAVITTGGGVVLDPENISELRRNGCIVALFAKPETIYRRVKDSRSRPLLRSSDVMGEIRRLLEQRKSLYENCDFKFETDDLASSQVADNIIKALESAP